MLIEHLYNYAVIEMNGNTWRKMCEVCVYDAFGEVRCEVTHQLVYIGVSLKPRIGAYKLFHLEPRPSCYLRRKVLSLPEHPSAAHA